MKDEKTVLIMRHAKSSWDDSSKMDFDRPLNKRGRKDAPAMGEYLADLGLIPDHIVCSTAERARETILLLAKASGFDKSNIQWNEDLYYDGVEAYLESFRSVPKDAEIVLVAGHNPTVENTVARLSGGSVKRKITTANIACFYTSASAWEDVSELNTTFKWLRGPKDI
jgi:phosphohistidine phosphatase